MAMELGKLVDSGPTRAAVVSRLRHPHARVPFQQALLWKQGGQQAASRAQVLPPRAAFASGTLPIGMWLWDRGQSLSVMVLPRACLTFVIRPADLAPIALDGAWRRAAWSRCACCRAACAPSPSTAGRRWRGTAPRRAGRCGAEGIAAA